MSIRHRSSGPARLLGLTVLLAAAGCEQGWDLRATVSYDSAAWTDGNRRLLVATSMVSRNLAKDDPPLLSEFRKRELWTAPQPPPVLFIDGAAVGCPGSVRMDVIAWLSERVPAAADREPLTITLAPGDLFARTGWIDPPPCTYGYEPLDVTLTLLPVP